MWLAQQTTPSPTEWLQFGVLGLVVVSLLLGWLWAKPAVDALRADKDRLIAAQDKRIDSLTAEVRELRNEIYALRRELRGKDGPGET